MNDNVILVGRKPLMNYVLYIQALKNEGKTEIILKARGRSISKAFDVLEMSRRRVLEGWEYSVVSGTESKSIDEKRVLAPDGKEWVMTKLETPYTKNVSTIEITIKGKPQEKLKTSTKDGI